MHSSFVRYIPLLTTRALKRTWQSNAPLPCASSASKGTSYQHLSPYARRPRNLLIRPQATAAISQDEAFSTDPHEDPNINPSKPRLIPQDLTRLVARASSAIDGSTLLIQRLLSIHPSPTSSFYHAALRALAVHPSPFLLHTILRDMRSAWVSLTPAGHHDVAVCLIRNSQLEEALDYVEQMRYHEKPAVPPQPWLWDMVLYSLIIRDDIDEALRTIHERVRSGVEHEIAHEAWYALFDEACTKLHYPSLAFIWGRQVRAKLDHDGLTPSVGQCTAVLRAAARNADPTLAQEAMRTLSDRGIVLDITHYELLMQAWLAAGDVARGVRVLTVMERAGYTPYRSSTRPLIQTLIANESCINEIWTELERIRYNTPPDQQPAPTVNPSATVPLAAINAVIEACIWYANAAMNGNPPFTTPSPNHASSHLQNALHYYKQLHKLCPAGPSRDTFNFLLTGCAVVPNQKSTAMFLASEMNALNISPNALTYDQLIQLCLREDGDETYRASEEARGKPKDEHYYEDAMRYMTEMLRRGWKPYPATMHNLVRACTQAGDKRVWALVERIREGGTGVKHVRTWVEKNWVEKRV